MVKIKTCYENTPQRSRFEMYFENVEMMKKFKSPKITPFFRTLF